MAAVNRDKARDTRSPRTTLLTTFRILTAAATLLPCGTLLTPALADPPVKPGAAKPGKTRPQVKDQNTKDQNTHVQKPVQATPEVVESVALGARIPAIDINALNAAAIAQAKRGDSALRAGQMRAAAQAYALAALASPRHPMPRLAAGVLLSEIGENKRALGQFRQALSLAEDDAIAALLLRTALAEQGDAQEAHEIYQDVYRRFAMPGKDGLNTTQSVARLQAALVSWNDSPVLHLLLGDAYQLSEDYGKADAAYQKAMQLAPNWCKPRVNLGISQLAQKKSEQAIATFEAALALDPRNAQARLGKGEGQLRAGRNRDAVTTFQSVTRLNYVSPQVAVQAMNGIGQAYLNSGRFVEADKILGRARAKSPNDPTVPTLQGEVRMQQGDAQGAISAYQTALNLTRSGGLFGNRAALLRSLAEAQLAAGHPEDALQTIAQALRDDPDDSALWHRLAARAYQSQGRVGEAREAFADALGAESGAYPLDTLRAMDAARAVQTVKAALARDLDNPNTTPASRVRAISALAHIARYEGDATTEIALRKRLIAARHTPRGWDWLLLAEVYDQKLGQPAPAREAYQKALQIGGLSDAATRFAKQRNKSLTEPMYNPK